MIPVKSKINLAIAMTVLICTFCAIIRHATKTQTVYNTLTPWACIGGCGAGGSGGSSGATAKWIGNGVSGGLLDVQLMYSSSATSKKSIANIMEPKFSIKPTYISTLALTVPIISKTGAMQASTASDEKTGIINNGIGDIRIDFLNTFGMEGNFSYNFTLGLPTGDYAATTGPDASKQFLSSNLQTGFGLYSLALDLGYTRDFDKGILLIDAIYTHMFAVNFSGKNRYFQFYNDANAWDQIPTNQQTRFRYFLKPYGENDLGAYTPPSVSLSAFYGYKGMQNYVHSVGVMFSAPLGVAWISGFNANSYQPTPDPDHQAWNATLCYGLEFTRTNYPLFFAVYLPIHDKTASATNAQLSNPYDTKPMAQWNGPDMNDVLRRWSFFLGVKTSLF